MIWRTYRVFHKGQAIMQITEKFPESAKLPSILPSSAVLIPSYVLLVLLP